MFKESENSGTERIGGLDLINFKRRALELVQKSPVYGVGTQLPPGEEQALLQSSAAKRETLNDGYYRHPDFDYDVMTGRVMRDNTAIALTPTEQMIFELLLQTPNKFVVNSTFAKAMWDNDRLETRRNLKVNVYRIKRKFPLEEKAVNEILKTRQGVGVMLKDKSKGPDEPYMEPIIRHPFFEYNPNDFTVISVKGMVSDLTQWEKNALDVFLANPNTALSQEDFGGEKAHNMTGVNIRMKVNRLNYKLTGGHLAPNPIEGYWRKYTLKSIEGDTVIG